MTNKTTINQRMLQIVEVKFDGNKAAFAKAVGIPPTSISNYFKQHSAIPSAEILEKIVNALNVNAYWLLTGQGEMSVPNQVEHSNSNTPRMKVTLELDLSLNEIRNLGLDDKIIKIIQ